MSNMARRYAHRDSSGEYSTGNASRSQDVPSEEDGDSTDSDDHGEDATPTLPNILRRLRVLKRQMKLNFRDLHDGLRDTNRRFDEQRADTNRRFDEQRADTNRRFDEQRADTNRRFDEQRADTNRRFDEQRAQMSQLKAQMSQLKAQQINQRATHINNPIQPVGRDDGTPIPIELSKRYDYVHKFLRLKRPDNWEHLTTLLRFYESKSWPTWGLISLSLGDGSDTEEPLMQHDTLEIAIEWAPESALQELARCIGLDYDKIMINVEEYERLQGDRIIQKKRAMAMKPTPSKRGRLGTPEHQSPHIPQTKKTEKAASIGTYSGEIGWDNRATEERTPESQRPRVKDAQHRQPTLSPTSVATSAQLPARTN